MRREIFKMRGKAVFKNSYAIKDSEVVLDSIHLYGIQREGTMTDKRIPYSISTMNDKFLLVPLEEYEKYVVFFDKLLYKTVEEAKESGESVSCEKLTQEAVEAYKKLFSIKF